MHKVADAAIPDDSQRDARILADAVLQAAEGWNLSHLQLGSLLETSAADVSDRARLERALASEPSARTTAKCLIGAFADLDAIMGGDDVAMRRWLAAPNQDLNARPAELLDDPDSLLALADYLEAARVRS